MSMIKTFNSAVSDAVNKKGDFYQVLVGQDPFTPEVTIVESADFNCGALCNELEFARTVSQYYVTCLDLDVAETTNLEDLILGFIDLPRRHETESDATYRKRFRFIVNEQTYSNRQTRWAILESISYFITDMATVQIIEIFDSENLYFQVRLEGVITYEDTIFLNNIDQAYVGQNFIGGAGVGEIITYLSALIQRIKAAGVDFDILFVDQNEITKTCDVTIGTVQLYKSCDAVVKAAVSFTKTSDATVV